MNDNNEVSCGCSCSKKSDKKERGASMVEYGLLVGLIVVVAIVAVRALGGEISIKFSSVASGVAS